jgi:electron transport complex protein RnfD
MMIYHVLAGGLFLGAIFMATDYSTSPMSAKGQIIFAIGCGFLASIIRFYGGYPEGVSYSILIMNLATPLIDMYTVPKKFGEVKKSA